MKKFASPGIDSHPIESGIYNSGAGLSPESKPYARNGRIVDPSSRNPTWDKETGRMIGNFPATQAPTPLSLRIRRRGLSPWSGYPGNLTRYYQDDSMDSMLNVGGSVDHNAGASSLIAGGPGAASSMVRMNGVERSNRGAKLPTLPRSINRGGDDPIPSGGQRGTIAAPLVPEMLGLPSVIKVGNAPARPDWLIPTPTTIPRWVINNCRLGLPRSVRIGSKEYFNYRGNLIGTYLPQAPAPPPKDWAFYFTYSMNGWNLTINPAITVTI